MDGWRAHARSILSPPFVPPSWGRHFAALRRWRCTKRLNVSGKRGDERRSFLIVRRPHCPIDCTRQQRKPPQLRALSSTNDTRIIPLHRPQQRNTGESFTWIRFKKLYTPRWHSIRGEEYAATCRRWKPISIRIEKEALENHPSKSFIFYPSW